jgi:chorismate mutase/prephenate dehydratase
MKKLKNTQNTDSGSRLKDLRNAIDDIDNNILDLINKRLHHAIEIGKIKKQSGDRVFDEIRENEIMHRLSSLNTGPIRNNVLLHIFKDIISESREIQQPLKVAFLGPQATFCHIAALNHFGCSVDFISQTNIRDIFGEVEKGACHYGVVPVENSIEGSVNYTLDLFFESDLKICAEIYQPISHDLLAASGGLKDIKVIYSHPQALAQCRKWLQKTLPDIPLQECSSTSFAAHKASEEPGVGAIASSEAARIYNLHVIASNIQDYSHNVTRFLVIGKNDSSFSGNDKTSIMFATAHAPGALYKALAPIAATQINMVKLESRPTKHENWNYFFFVDIEGHKDDPNVHETLTKMKPLCLYIKSLGSYPKAQ